MFYIVSVIFSLCISWLIVQKTSTKNELENSEEFYFKYGMLIGWLVAFAAIVITSFVEPYLLIE